MRAAPVSVPARAGVADAGRSARAGGGLLGAVGIIPSLLEDPAPLQSVYEVAAMLCGVASMAVIALAEH